MTLLKQISILTLLLAFVFPLVAQTFALNNINVVDVRALKIIANQTVIIENNLIKSIGAADKQKLAKGLITLDMAGKYLIPGLIDSHVHHATSPDDADNDQITRMRLRKLLQGGVTSVRDMGGDTRVLSSLKRRADNDIILAPDIYYSVIIAGAAFFFDPRAAASAKGEIPGDVDWMRAVNENSHFDEVMLKTIGTGATGIKIYAQVPENIIYALARSAKKYGLKVWSHAFVGPAKPQQIVTGGVETISHAPDIAAQVVDDFYQLRRERKSISNQQKAQSFKLTQYQALFDDMKNHGTILDATLSVFEKQQSTRGEPGQLLYEWGHTFTRMAHENGIPISTGTDGKSDYYQTAYPLVQHEMQLLVNDVGMSPLQAIQAATLNGAKVIGIENTHGDISMGKVANLVILNQDPSENIESVQNIAHVIKNGQFITLVDDKKRPYVSAIKSAGMLSLSGQIGNFPSTNTLVGPDVTSQMTQAMKNIGRVLQVYDLNYRDITKCTLLLVNIDDWQQANDAYITFFATPPAHTASATTGLVLNAKVEVECIAEL